MNLTNIDEITEKYFKSFKEINNIKNVQVQILRIDNAGENETLKIACEEQNMNITAE